MAGTQFATLGANQYSVSTLNWQVDTGFRNADLYVHAQAIQTPEPSTLLLAGVALPILGLGRRFRRASVVQ